MAKEIIIRKAKIYVKIPVTCHTCNGKALSEPMLIEMEHCTPQALERRFETLRVGTFFPVGWASYAQIEDHKVGSCTRARTIYKCPKCID